MWSELFSYVFSNLLYFSLHLEHANNFPKPLSAVREKECFDAAARGDTAARNELIEHNLRLVAHIAKKYNAVGADAEDLLSIGTIGLIKAVSTFSSEKGNRFATYAARCIENEILMYFRSMKKSSGNISISDPIETDKDGNPLTLLDLIADDTDVADIIDLKLKTSALYKYVEKDLDEREKQVICCHYGLYGQRPLTQQQIAKKLRISRSYVSRLEKKALEKLREGFDGKQR